MTDDDEKDPFFEDTLDEAMADLQGKIPPEQFAMIRGVLREEMREDATAMRLLGAARPRAVPKQSGDRPASGAGGVEPPGPPAAVMPLRRRTGG